MINSNLKQLTMETSNIIKLSWLLLIIAVVSLSCKKENGNDAIDDQAGSSVMVRLTQPASASGLKYQVDSLLFDEVNIDIESVSIHYGDSSSNGQWIDLATNSGIYDLTDLSNLGLVLADSNGLIPGYISQMRLMLGDSNTVMVDSVLYDLKTPSGQQSGLKLNLDMTIRPGYQYEILLEFDPEESVVVQGNGRYLLKPVIRVVTVIENLIALPEETSIIKSPSIQ